MSTRTFITLALTLVQLHTAVAQNASDTVRLIFGGDVMLSGHLEAVLENDRSHVFRQWDIGRNADVFMVNLEHPITTATEEVEKTFNFKMHPRFVGVMKDAGISIVAAANNHIYDYGVTGILETMASLDSAGIRYVGIGRTLDEARTPVVLNIRGHRIGFLSYYGKSEFPATDSTPGFAPRNPEIIRRDISSLRPAVDFIVVNFHWGVEKSEFPEPWQVRLGRQVIRFGADLVVGHHPHVLQGIERYNGGTIAYSLGNFVFGGNSRDSYDTAVLQVEMSDSTIAVEILPVRVKNWQVLVPDEKRAASIRALVASRSTQFEDTISGKSGE